MGGSGQGRSALVSARPRGAGEAAHESGPPRRRSRVVLPARDALLTGAVVCDYVLTLSAWTGGARMRGLPVWPVLVTWNGQLVGTLLVFVALVALAALSGRVWVALGLAFSLALPLAAANHVKLVLRKEPVYPSDVDFLSQPGFLGSVVRPGQLVLLGLLVVVPLTGCFLAGRVLARRHPQTRRSSDPQAWRRHVLLRRPSGCLPGTARACPAVQRRGQPVARALRRDGERTWRNWSQSENYMRNGFVGGFLYNTDVEVMTAPPGYGPETMDEVAERYERVAARLNRGRTPGALSDVNVVLVLGEGFSDPTRLSGLEPAEDPIPRTRATTAATTSGLLLSEGFGGGTATMEFEVLTGMPLRNFAPQVTSPYQMVVPDLTSFPSVVGALAAEGHTTVAIHPFSTEMYRREEVYRTFGFDEFVHDSTMAEQTRIERSPYLSDSAAYDEVLAREATSTEPLLAHVVTMQNHMPWANWYDDPVPVSGPLDVDSSVAVGTYLRGLEYSDDGLAAFLGALRRSRTDRRAVLRRPPARGLRRRRARRRPRAHTLQRRSWCGTARAASRARSRSPVRQPAPPAVRRRRRAAAAVPRAARVPAPAAARRDPRPPRHRGRDEVTNEARLPPATRRLLDDLRLTQYDFSVGHRYALEAMWPKGERIQRGIA